MRKMYTTKRLLGTAAAAAALFAAAPAFTQDGGEEVELFAEDGKDNGDQKVEVGATGEIDLHVKELEITKVLQLLSIQSKRNIIASKSVENAKVSADLYGVSFEDALKSILEPNGFGYVEEGNFIYVLTAEEIAERDLKNRKLATKIHRLDYLRADEAAAFVTPMLSDNGAITASGNVEDGIDPGLDNPGSNGYAGPTTLVIRDYEDSIQEITTVLEELDAQPVNVIIEATVLRSTLTENNQFGVDFSLFTDLTGTTPLSIVDSLVSGAPDNQRAGGIVSDQGFDTSSSVKLGFVAGDAAVFISALDDVTDTTIVASPKVTVLDRNATKILVGEKIAYLSTTVTETSETQTVEFLEVGTQLNVRPFVSSDGKIRLELRPSVSDATIRTIGTTSAPDESTVELVTNVIVDSGQTVVLGGLITDDTSISRSQVPGLGDVPLLGAAFQGQDDTVSRSEVIFLVKATVVGNETLNALGDEGLARVDVARLAEREQLLPWSRSKLTAAHMMNARNYYDQALTLTGEARDEMMAEALYCVDMALHMNPSMVDALMLKEQITGQPSYITYEDSIVKDTYEAVLEHELKALGVPELPLEEQPVEDEAAQAFDLIEPEPLSQQDAPQFDLFGEPIEPQPEPFAEAPAEQAIEPQAQAEADAEAEMDDDAWLDQVLADQFAEENTQPQAEPDSAETPEQPAETTEFAQQPATEEATEQPAEEAVEETVEAPAEPEPTEISGAPTNTADDFATEGGEQAQPQTAEVFGFSWRSLTTAQLLQLAAEAAESAQQAEAEFAEESAEPDTTTADVPTDTE